MAPVVMSLSCSNRTNQGGDDGANSDNLRDRNHSIPVHSDISGPVPVQCSGRIANQLSWDSFWQSAALQNFIILLLYFRPSVM